MTTIYTGICTMSGVRFFISEMMILENINTTIVANPIIIPLVALVVVANVGHIPSINTNIGFSFIMPFNMIPNLLIVKYPLNCEFTFCYLSVSAADRLAFSSTKVEYACCTARKNALEVIVEAVIALISPPSFLTVRLVFAGLMPTILPGWPS